MAASTTNGRRRKATPTNRLITTAMPATTATPRRTTPANLPAKLVLVTPVMATAFLQKRPANQLPLSETRARIIADDFSAGKIKLSPSPLVFNRQGELVDGQHRCRAIEISGVSVWMWVYENAADDVIEIIDMNRSRSAADTARVLGLAYDAAHIAVAKGMLNGITKLSRRRKSRMALLEFVKEHEKAINFAIEVTGGKQHYRGLTIKGIRSPIARAYYTGQTTRLREFGDILLTNIPKNPEADSGALLLSNFLMRCNSAKGMQTSPSVVYRKTEMALVYFLAKHKLERLTEVKEEQFPLPGEEALLDDTSDGEIAFQGSVAQ